LKQHGTALTATWAVPFMACLLFMACKKPEKDLGLDLLPGDELGLMLDTATIHAFTYADSAIRTSGLTRNLVGAYLDPQFGFVKAGIVTQIRLSANNVGAGQDNSGLVADSLVLALAFDGINYVYGNLDPQVFRVYELSEDLSVDTIYRTDDVPEVLPEDLVFDRGGRITPRPLSQVVVGGDSLQPQLRIRLDRALADRFLAAFGTSDLVDNSSFLSFFKGLYITVEDGSRLPFQQGILYFNLLNAASKVTLYYRDTLVEDAPPRQFDFPINQNSVRYTVVEHDHGQAMDPALMLALADTVSPASLTYVQALGGLRTVIRFPNLMDYATAGLALAKAELVVPLGSSFNAYLVPPAQLFIFRKGENGADAFLPDQTGGIGSIDGSYRGNAREYRFNVTRYVQGVLNGSLPDTGVQLVAASNGITANRVVLAGPAGQDKRMRLQLTFTTY
jgi:hypothetical protein